MTASSESTPTADLDLLRRMTLGDTAALGDFHDRHAGTLFALSLRILNDAAEAEDVVQDTLLQIWEKAVVFDPEQGRPLAWAITLARNKAIDRLRTSQRRARLLEEAGLENDCATEPDAAQAAHTGEQGGLVRAALRGLPTEQRRVIEMAFFGGLSQSEIAEAIAEPLGTVKARIRRGMLRLRDELEPKL